VTKNLFGSKRDEISRQFRILHKVKLRDLYKSLRIVKIVKSRKLRCAGHVARIEETRKACRILVRKFHGICTLGRNR
jgi:hypothetical protein